MVEGFKHTLPAGHEDPEDDPGGQYIPVEHGEDAIDPGGQKTPAAQL